MENGFSQAVPFSVPCKLRAVLRKHEHRLRFCSSRRLPSSLFESHWWIYIVLVTLTANESLRIRVPNRNPCGIANCGAYAVRILHFHEKAKTNACKRGHRDASARDSPAVIVHCEHRRGKCFAALPQRSWHNSAPFGPKKILIPI